MLKKIQDFYNYNCFRYKWYWKCQSKKRVAFSQDKEKNFIISSFFISNHTFCKSSLTIQCILRNKIIAKILVHIDTTKYGFVNKEFTERICQVLEIKTQHLIKSKQIQGFDIRTAKSITRTIYLTLTIYTLIKSLALLLMIKLENHPLIFGQSKIKKHRVIIDMMYNFLVFWLVYCNIL